MFYSTSALAGSFNGHIAYGIEENLVGYNGWTAWQWLYLVEDVVDWMLFLIFFFLPPTPERGHFLFTKTENELVIRRS
jgi:hypothetical protein